MVLIVLSPEKELLRLEDATAVELPGTKGRFTVLQNHAPLVTSLEPGLVRYRSAASPTPSGTTGSDFTELPINGGFARIENNTITVCAA